MRSSFDVQSNSAWLVQLENLVAECDPNWRALFPTVESFNSVLTSISSVPDWKASPQLTRWYGLTRNRKRM